MPVAPLLALRGVCKRFGGVQALTDVELEIRAGEVVALVGDNGAGKTTLAKVIAGVVPADEGVIEWKGRAVEIKRPRLPVSSLSAGQRQLIVCAVTGAADDPVAHRMPSAQEVQP